MNKIKKIIFVLLILFNYFLSCDVKVKAASNYLPWKVNYTTSKGDRFGEFVTTQGDGWGTTLSSAELVQELFFITSDFNVELSQGYSLTFDTVIDVSGIYPINFLSNVVFVDINGNECEVALNENEISETLLVTDSGFKHTLSINYTNNSSVKYKSLIIKYKFLESSNVLSTIVQAPNTSYEVKKGSALVEEENSENIKGILGYVKSIFSGIAELPTNIANNLSWMFQGITNAVNNIENWLTNLLTGILDGLKALFIPSDDYFETYTQSWNNFFNEKFGLLIFPINAFQVIYDRLMNLEYNEPILAFEGFEFMNVKIIPEFSFNLNDLLEYQDIQVIYMVYTLATDFILIMLFINFLYKTLNEILGGQ